MLPKAKRLRSFEVDHVLSRGESVRFPAQPGKKPLISMKFIHSSGKFRAAVIAPKSLVRKATDRNRVRRAVYRALYAETKPKNGATAVFFVRSLPPAPLTPAFAEEIRYFLAKI